MKILIAIPCMDTVPVGFATSLINLRKTEDTCYAVRQNTLIYDSRNILTAQAIQGGYDRMLWLDSDMCFDPDLLERLSKDMDEGRDFVTALCFKRHSPTKPTIYQSLTYQTEPEIRASAVCMEKYPQDEVFKVAGSGFAATMVKVDVLRKAWEKYGPPFNPLIQMGEDLSCCYRLTQMGVTMYCDSGAKVGHIGQTVYDERMYLNEQKVSAVMADI